MKASKDKRKLGALVILVMLLAVGTFFSIRKMVAPLLDSRLSTVHPAPASQRYAGMIPDELTPPGEETPINTPQATATPIATP